MDNILRLATAISAVCILLIAPVSSAQTPPSQTTTTTSDGSPDPAAVRVRIGPLWMNPSISIPNVGIDTNVFNDPPSRAPQQDFTITLLPKTDLWLRMGRTWLTGLISEEVVWYQEFATERSVNDTYMVGWRAPLNRLLVTTSATWTDTRSRPGYEIDTRAQRTEPTYAGSVEVRGFARTLFGARASLRKVRFDDEVMYQGDSLKNQLDRTVTTAAATVRRELTPLTNLTFVASRSEEHFDVATSRDSVSEDYSIELTFDPAAIIKGNATFGYKRYQPLAADLPGYDGSTANVGLTYTLLGSTRLTATLGRGIDFSYDIDQPYYLLSGGSGSISQRIYGPVDVVVRAGAQHLHYQTRAGADVVAPDRTDRVHNYGFGVGVHLGQDWRLGFNVDKDRRMSVIPDHEYEGLKYGSSVTFGL